MRVEGVFFFSFDSAGGSNLGSYVCQANVLSLSYIFGTFPYVEASKLMQKFGTLNIPNYRTHLGKLLLHPIRGSWEATNVCALACVRRG